MLKTQLYCVPIYTQIWVYISSRALHNCCQPEMQGGGRETGRGKGDGEGGMGSGMDGEEGGEGGMGGGGGGRRWSQCVRLWSQCHILLQGAVLLYDITIRETYLNVVGWLESIKEHGSHNICVAIVGHKADLEDERVVTTDEGKKVRAN